MTQKEALNLLMMGNNVFLTGQAGSGKTYLLNSYIDFLKENKIEVATHFLYKKLRNFGKIL